MNRVNYFDGMLVAEGDLNTPFTYAENAERNLSLELGEVGVLTGLNVSPTSPVSSSVDVSTGSGRIKDDGARVRVDSVQTVPCNQTTSGDPTYSDLVAGEGRWVSFYIKFKREYSDQRTPEGGGVPVYFKETESYEFQINNGTKGLIADKDTLAKAGTLTTALLLADIWFESGSGNIDLADLDVTRREDYMRETISGTQQVFGNPNDTLVYLMGRIEAIFSSVTGSSGASLIGLGGTDTEATFLWQIGKHLSATSNNVEAAISKIVLDLGNSRAQTVDGADLISAVASAPNWFTDPLSDPGGGGSYDGTVGSFLNNIIADLASAKGSECIGSQAVAGSPYSLTSEAVYTQISSILSDLNTHVNTGGHPATAISHDPTTSTWADASTLGAANGGVRWNDLLDALAATGTGTSSPAGIKKIGTTLVNGTYDGDTISIGGSQNLYAFLTELVEAVARRIDVTGDSRITGNLIPKAGFNPDLGSVSNRFDAAYLKGRLYFNSAENIENRQISALLGSCDPGANLAFNNAGYVTSGAVSQSLFFPLDYLKDSDALSSVEVEWNPNSSSSMDLYIYKMADGGSRTQVARLTSSITARGSESVVLGPESMASNTSYWIEVVFNDANDVLYKVRPKRITRQLPG